MEFSLKEISTYRTELMGLSAIAILFCHAVGNNVLMPDIISSVLSIGGYGVDMFLFLSGMGLWYSLDGLKNQRGGGKILVYKKIQKIAYPLSNNFCLILHTFLCSAR